MRIASKPGEGGGSESIVAVWEAEAETTEHIPTTEQMQEQQSSSAQDQAWQLEVEAAAGQLYIEEGRYPK